MSSKVRLLLFCFWLCVATQETTSYKLFVRCCYHFFFWGFFLGCNAALQRGERQCLTHFCLCVLCKWRGGGGGRWQRLAHLFYSCCGVVCDHIFTIMTCFPFYLGFVFNLSIFVTHVTQLLLFVAFDFLFAPSCVNGYKYNSTYEKKNHTWWNYQIKYSSVAFKLKNLYLLLKI